MAYVYSDLTSDINAWGQQAESKGWISKALAESLVDEEQDTADSLFVQQNARPLVVAFMGGTGVGKSSLLNKLAGQSIAKTGVERPTSREVTLFHHQSISIHQLEEKFPLQQIQLAQHTEESNRNVLWIDMPDFDSTEEKNKDIVMQWLPYVDVLVYVVSPERYRDNKAWQLLLSEGASHAWLFVMNQWDRGEEVQFDDFKKQLALAGFNNPHIFKTISINDVVDELPQLKITIQSLATGKTVEHLEQRNLQLRKNALKQNLKNSRQELGDKTIFPQLLYYQKKEWEQTEIVLKQGFDWPIKQASMAYSKTKLSLKKEKVKLWDEWAQGRLNDYLDDLVLTADQKGLPATPLRNDLLAIRGSAEKIIHTQTELGCRQALTHPGNLVQRIFLKTMAVFEIILPLVAMGVVGFQVFYGFYDSAVTDEEFLGTDFAVHSVLLIILSWLIPFFILKKMQPSLEKAALKGLNKGLETATARIELDVKQAINNQQDEHKEITQSLEKLINACGQEGGKSLKKGEQLSRMLVD